MMILATPLIVLPHEIDTQDIARHYVPPGFSTNLNITDKEHLNERRLVA